MRNRKTAAICLMAWVCWVGNGQALAAPILEVGGSLTYDSTTDDGMLGFALAAPFVMGVNNSGTAVGCGREHVSGSDMGLSVARWDASGTTATKLDGLGISSAGHMGSEVYGINGAGTAVGSSQKYVETIDRGMRAVRWDAGGTAATELGGLGTDVDGASYARAYGINSVGTAVGISEKYDASGLKVGSFAVRWDAGGTAATELDALGINGGAEAYAINNSGTVVGCGSSGNPGWFGSSAVRWDAGGTAVTELDNLGVASYPGFSIGEAKAYAVNDAGTAVGYSQKYVGTIDRGMRAVRWDAGGTAATELGDLGIDADGKTKAQAFAVNNAGTAVGYSEKHVSSRDRAGIRAVRWDAGSATATELGNLGTKLIPFTHEEYTESQAFAVNDAGTAVGFCAKYVSNILVGNRAVAWLPDATAVDLNDLGVAPVPAGGTWTLLLAGAISADGWVAGEGMFDPDGPGPVEAYRRHWVGQVGLGGSWLNTTSANNTWGKGANWSTGTSAIQRDADFDQAAAYIVALDGDQTARAAHITAGNVTFALNAHSLTLTDGLTVSSEARLASNGTFVAAVSNAGMLAPDTLTIDGDLDSTGTIEFQIDGAGAANTSRLIVTGEADLGGVIKIALGYAPANGNTFDLMDWDSLIDSGYSFDLSQAVVPAGLRWDTAAFADTGTIGVILDEVTPGPTGDANADGVVDAADYIILKQRMGGSAMLGAEEGDFDGSGTVDWADLQILIGDINGGTGLLSIPEPATIGLLALGGLAVLPKRRK